MEGLRQKQGPHLNEWKQGSIYFILLLITELLQHLVNSDHQVCRNVKGHVFLCILM